MGWCTPEYCFSALNMGDWHTVCAQTLSVTGLRYPQIPKTPKPELFTYQQCTPEYCFSALNMGDWHTVFAPSVIGLCYPQILNQSSVLTSSDMSVVYSGFDFLLVLLVRSHSFQNCKKHNKQLKLYSASCIDTVISSISFILTHTMLNVEPPQNLNESSSALLIECFMLQQWVQCMHSIYCRGLELVIFGGTRLLSYLDCFCVWELAWLTPG